METSALYSKFGKDFEAGKIIFCEFEFGNDFFLIQSGKVKISKIVKNTEKTMDILGPGDIFGEMAILEEQPRSATAIAVDKVSVLNFNRENFVTLMTSQPQLAYKLLLVFAKRIYDAKRRLMILLLGDVQTKLADVFLMLSEHEPNFDALKEVVLPVTVDDLAKWCGESVDEVQPIINHWIKQDKVEVFADKIIVKNLPDLKRLVGMKRKAKR